MMRPYSRGSIGPEGEDRGGRVLAAVRVEQVAQEPRAQPRRVAARGRTGRRRRRPAPRAQTARASPVPRGSAWTATSTPSNALAPSGDVTTTSGSASTARAASTTQSTIRRPSNAWKCFGVAERMRVPRPPASTTAAGFCTVHSGSLLGRQDSNLGSRDQNPLPYRLATPQRELRICHELKSC